MTSLDARITGAQKSTGTMSGRGSMCGTLSIQRSKAITLQSKTVVPTDVEQVVTPDSGYTGLERVTVAPIPKNYGKITYNGYSLTVE